MLPELGLFDKWVEFNESLRKAEMLLHQKLP